MSLENLTEAEKRQLNLGALVATMLVDSKLSKETKRLLKAKNPELQFPELETDDALEKVRADSKKESDDLRAELARRDAVAALRDEEAQIKEAGFDPKVIRDFMNTEGITNLNLVLEVFSIRQLLAEPSADATGSGPFRFKDVTQEDLKAMWENPQKWREEKAYAVQQELRGTARRRA